MATKMKLRGTNDDQFIESMSFENYVQAGIMRQVANLPQSALENLNKSAQEKKQDKVLRQHLRMMQEFVGSDGVADDRSQQGASENKKGSRGGANEGGSGAGEGTPE